MPWNQMMANTTQDRAGIPWKKVNTGARKFSAVLEWPMIIAENPAEDEGAEQPTENSPRGEQYIDQKGSRDQYLDGA